MFMLLRMALYNPVNAYFVLLSESCLPLYPAAVVYLQLVHGRKSRIDGAQPAPRQAPHAALRLRLPHLLMLYIECATRVQACAPGCRRLRDGTAFWRAPSAAPQAAVVRGSVPRTLSGRVLTRRHP
jgi:hypothetical protein